MPFTPIGPDTSIGPDTQIGPDGIFSLGGGPGLTYTDIPYGLEAKWTINGITLNDKSSYNAYFLTKIGGLDDADVRFQNDVNPGYDGEYPLPMFYGGRTLTFTGYIRSLNLGASRLMAKNLRSAFLVKYETPLIASIGSGTDMKVMARKSAPLSITEELMNRTDFRRDFLITLRASDPRFLSNSLSSVSVNVNAASVNLSVSNLGNYYAFPVITIHGPLAAGAKLLAPSGAYLQLSVALASGDIYTIDYKKRSVVDQNNANRYASLATGSTWFPIPPGSGQTYVFTSTGYTGGTSNISMSWNDAWM